ncbi:2-keto-4-pentenoate hydratase/2-oxohepta-3-ene-1,7-dioic acid hydratase in catechol pathway [Evansella vedderi]|uniref:2-keto-4-pentenoate hydratase/2-oxohepta-3-ene-1,7-dioic acid hydratase in catechol pathway n=1 Tax=Evansella vedderi TaxID=38282 RepID=A0ABT9ZWW5_9BACI|nr:fumarylacetoacetate hydrolase family protein [Evansella vedderi]MDQ0255724.1 2-keto-4-pentenoate hydratase/2-oxohepta-3-ene-1,7-dioic acid hydratase in catechol pathway [Evansella vedderi]
MKFIRFTKDSNTYQGVLKENVVEVIEGYFFGEWNYTGESFLKNEVQLLAPLEPKHIIGIGANFVGSKEDLPETQPEIPVFFFKPTTSVIGPEEEIVIPEAIDQVKFESELAIVIGKEAKNLNEEDVLDYIFGYTVANDVTAPQFFREDGHWMVGKSFDTFTPLGPVIETELDPFNVVVEARLNGEKKQHSATELMIVPIRRMISYLSNVMTLNKGDVILTGSPLGAELVNAGDTIECEIKEIGVLRNTFTAAKEKINS